MLIHAMVQVVSIGEEASNTHPLSVSEATSLSNICLLIFGAGFAFVLTLGEESWVSLSLLLGEQTSSPLLVIDTRMVSSSFVRSRLTTYVLWLSGAVILNISPTSIVLRYVLVA